MPSVRPTTARPCATSIIAPGPTPDFAVYLPGASPAPVAWEARWVRWPEFRLPRNRRDAAEVLSEAWHRAETERVEIACGSGRRRTGAALACIAVLDGVSTHEAGAFVREHCDSRPVETHWQRRYVTHFRAV